MESKKDKMPNKRTPVMHALRNVKTAVPTAENPIESKISPGYVRRIGERDIDDDTWND